MRLTWVGHENELLIAINETLKGKNFIDLHII